jgi:hypothetical protein
VVALSQLGNEVLENGTDPIVSVVIPCLNEVGAIARVVRRTLAGFVELSLPGEVIIVDNGSTDGSAAEAARAGARVVIENRPGYGSALKRGFAEARGRYIIMADGDDTYPTDNLRPFIALLEHGCDVVYGDRFAGGIDPQAMSWSHRYVGTPVLSWLVRKLSGVAVTDSQCGMRGFRREALERLDLRASGMDLNMEMLIKVGQAGLVVGEVPIRLARRIGESKLQTIPDGWRNLRYLLVSSPEYLFLLPGVALLLLGVVMLGLQSGMPRGVSIGSITWLPQFAPLILGSVGTQLIWFAIIANLYYTNTGFVKGDQSGGGLMRIFSRYFSLEWMLLISLVVVAAGAGLEVLLGLQQFDLISPNHTLASVGAFSVIVGLQSFFSSFIAYLLSSEQTRPSVRISHAVVRNPAGPLRTAQAPMGELLADVTPSPAPNTMLSAN